MTESIILNLDHWDVAEPVLRQRLEAVGTYRLSYSAMASERQCREMELLDELGFTSTEGRDHRPTYRLSVAEAMALIAELKAREEEDVYREMLGAMLQTLDVET